MTFYLRRQNSSLLHLKNHHIPEIAQHHDIPFLSYFYFVQGAEHFMHGPKDAAPSINHNIT
jgi:hypothetical protein